MTMIGFCCFEGRELAQVCFLPCLINKENQPVPLTVGEERGKQVLDYVGAVTGLAELPTAYVEGGPMIGGYRTVVAR